MKPTIEQAEITDAAATLRKGENLKVIAFAGAGKTTTLKACAQARKDRGIYLAFNREIAAEAKQKLATTKCDAKTMHGLAYKVMVDIMGAPEAINARTVLDAGILTKFHVPKVRGWGDYRIAGAVSRTMSTFAGSADAEFGPQHATQALIESMGDPEFIISEEKAEFTRDAIEKMSGPLAQMASDYWVQCMNKGDYSFDMYLKMLDIDDGLRNDAFRRYNYIMVDEAQDINPVQRSILTKTGLPLIAVGDPFQQIYSWRGAENALGLLPGKELHLTQSFRFGENIAVIARSILESIPGGGPEKKLIGSGPGAVSEKYSGAVICRTNIGMLDEAMRYINKGHPVHVDNIQGLLDDAESAQALHDGRMQDVKSAELKQFENWAELEMASEEGADPGLTKLVNLIRTNRLPDVRRLSKQENRSSDKVSLHVYTAHRSKGLEFDAVQLGDDWADINSMNSRYKAAKLKSEKHATQAGEAFNALYVATTRAKLRCKGYGRILKPDDSMDKGPMTQEEAAAMHASRRSGGQRYEAPDQDQKEDYESGFSA